MNTEIPGYVYIGDVGSVADCGGRWIGVGRGDTLGHIIEVIGAGEFRGGDEEGAIITAGDIHVRGHVEMRQAIDSCGWAIRGLRDRDHRRAMLLDAYVGHHGFDVGEDFDGRHEARVMTDAEAIEQANRWAR